MRKMNFLSNTVFRSSATNNVRKYAALILVSAYLFNTMGLSELFKINKLLQHFYVTKQITPELSFGEFLVMHYVTDDQNNNDNEEDTQLPFKAPGLVTSGISPGAAPIHVTHNFNIPLSKEADFSPTDVFFVAQEHLNAIWHPPQIA